MSEVKIPMSKKEYDEKIDKIKLCGVNRGPHKYEPVSWLKVENREHVQTFMCMVCFTRVQAATLYANFDEAKIV